MDLSTATSGQRQAVEHVGGPLLVSAGAGSGKTFTLTQRIAYGLLPESGPAASSVDEVLAVTFTTKAANEIKARVKRTLRAEGLGAEALRIDGAWVSTIHGMCTRILRAHALDLGIDPSFSVMSEAVREDVLARALDEAMRALEAQRRQGRSRGLLDEYPVRSAAFGGLSVRGAVEGLLARSSALGGGLDAVAWGGDNVSPADAARAVLDAMEGPLQTFFNAVVKKTASSEKHEAAVEQAVADLQEYLLDATRNASWEALARLLESVPLVPKNFGPKESRFLVAEYQEAHLQALQEVRLGLARPFAEELACLAEEVRRIYGRKKRALGVLDQDDLLSETYRALTEHPDIAKRYGEKFSLVMVDEFQDTSAVQVDLIGALAGENLRRLCTVGDSQQSIYRFRGADVNVYERHKETMARPEVGALCLELSKNFRSHRDVLSFVDAVFSQPETFGRRFMSLAPHDGRPSGYRGSAPRIDVVFARSCGGSGTDAAVRTAAAEMARRFAQLRREGHPASDMAVLLGSMSKAGAYAEALRGEGFECVVTGGSKFSEAPEVLVVQSLLHVLANPADTLSLYAVLTSGMFKLSADDLLALATEGPASDAPGAHRSLWRGLRSLDAEAAGRPSLSHAASVLGRAWKACGREAASCTVERVLRESGWLWRLEREGAQGRAVLANVLKALRLVESVEQAGGLGPASVSQAFDDELAVMKAPPGALAGSGEDTVRIMTIHASKGLEFPIVGLGEFWGSQRTSSLVMEIEGDALYASLAPSRTLDGFPELKRRTNDAKLLECLSPQDEPLARAAERTPAQFRARLVERNRSEERDELFRKLYVGVTRASEALVVAMYASVKEKAKPKDGDGAPDLPKYPVGIEEVRSALFGGEDFPCGAATFDYGGTEPGRFTCVDAAPSEEAEGTDGAAWDAGSSGEEAFFVPADAAGRSVRPHPQEKPARESFSYTSLSHAAAAAAGGQEPGSAVGVSCGLGAKDASVADADGSKVGPAAGAGGSALDAEAAFAADGAAPLQRSAAADEATALGTAFHRACQWAFAHGRVPDAGRLASWRACYGLSDAAFSRLEAAADAFFGGSLFDAATAFEHCQGEVPFFLPVGDRFLEGEIDLLCYDGDACGARALVYDYKTGGRSGETQEAVEDKHRLQGACYAYALLASGFSEVTLKFIRVERLGEEGGVGVVEYRYAQDALPSLDRLVRQASEAAS